MRRWFLLGAALLRNLASAAKPCDDWPKSCPGTAPRAPYKQTWQMNLSTIIMPCNNTGYTSPSSTLGWGIIDFDWSNGKGTGTADGWVKHQPMDDEEMLFEQVRRTTKASPGTTVWVYRNTVYAYPWYTSVRKTLEDPAYSPWYFKFAGAEPGLSARRRGLRSPRLRLWRKRAVRFLRLEPFFNSSRSRTDVSRMVCPLIQSQQGRCITACEWLLLG